MSQLQRTDEYYPTAEVSEKSRGISLALGVPLGMFGAHRFYLGKIGTGILQILTLGGLGLWWMYDLILLAAGGFEDAMGRKVLNWQESDAPRRQLPEGITQDILDELYALRDEMGDLSERVDFAERMLAEKDRKELGDGGPSPG